MNMASVGKPKRERNVLAYHPLTGIIRPIWRFPVERYVFQEVLAGTGGYGKVRVAHDTSLDRDVAVKTLDPLVKSLSSAEQERFRREARTLAKMSHPNIPAVYDVEFTADTLDIYFQYIAGDNLRRIIEKNGPTQIGDARRWFYQIASALEHAHKLNIIHRDIKPENIIITPDMQTAYLVDFGIALSAEEAKRLTGAGYVIGTRAYMSPEQLAGEVLDHRTDLYSLGLTFYEVLAGQRIPAGNYEDLSTKDESIPPAIDYLIQECLEPRDRRLSSARMFETRLTEALAQPPKPLSDILAHGRLQELANALENLSPVAFTDLPLGQRTLILSKVYDVVGSNERALRYAAERFLQLLLVRGVLLPKEDYIEIVHPAIQWAFEMEFDDKVGRESIRKALEKAAFIARDGAYDVLTVEILEYLKDIDVSGKDDWYLHTIREVVEALMANQECSTNAAGLGVIFRKINRVQRGKPWRSYSR